MADPARSPEITRLTWGRVEVEGQPPFKDAKVYPGGARAWSAARRLALRSVLPLASPLPSTRTLMNVDMPCT